MKTQLLHSAAPIGVFDSGFGGLSILKEIRKTLPQYDYLFIGDNARAPYGSKSFDMVYEFTLQCVQFLFAQGCNLVILACNTASAKALRTIQQKDLPNIDPAKRVLGVIRPTVEKMGELTKSGNIGILGTPATIQSRSYDIEVSKMYDNRFNVYSHACPMWVPLVENRESENEGADYFVKKDIDLLLAQNAGIDTIILGCTHYPHLLKKIEKYTPSNVKIVPQGAIVAESLKDYLLRHPKMETLCSKGGQCTYCTTENAENFSQLASVFVNENVVAQHVTL